MLVGKTVESFSYPSQYDHIVLTFTDGTTLRVKEVGYTGEIEVQVNEDVLEPQET